MIPWRAYSCYPLQYSCLENPMDKGAWSATVHGVAKNQTQSEQLSTAQRQFEKDLVLRNDTWLHPTCWEGSHWALVSVLNSSRWTVNAKKPEQWVQLKVALAELRNFWLRPSKVALVVKNLPANAGDTRDVGSISGSGKSPGEGNGNPLQYSCLENPMDRGAWWATVHKVARESDSLKWLSTYTHKG